MEPKLFPLPNSGPPGFSAFWEVWPRKQARVAAERAWKTAIKKAAPLTIISGAQAYADSLNNTEMRFVLHASTFLNQERWTDYRCDIKPQDTESPQRKMWRLRLKDYRPNGFWPSTWSGRPGTTDYQGPKDLEEIALAHEKKE